MCLEVYAIIETGGKQYRVSEGDFLRVEKLECDEGASVVFDKVLFVSDDNGVKVGTPLIDGAKVEATAVQHGKGKKIIVFKYKSKKNYRKRRGHRQPYTKVNINTIIA